MDKLSQSGGMLGETPARLKFLLTPLQAQKFFDGRPGVNFFLHGEKLGLDMAAAQDAETAFRFVPGRRRS